MYAQVDGFNQELRTSGAWVFAGGLEPASTATVVTSNGSGTTMTDGPYIEAKEHLGGFWVVEAADLDVALQMAGRASAACEGPGRGSPLPGDACVTDLGRQRWAVGTCRRAPPALPSAPTPARSGRPADPPGVVLERVFRAEYGRIVASLVRPLGGIDPAEEAAADALAIAAERWPRDGVPPNPGAWLMTTARNRGIDRLRREASRQSRHEEAHRMVAPDAEWPPTRMTTSSPTTSSG